MPPGRPETGKKLRIFPVFAAFAKVSRKRGLWLIVREKADVSVWLVTQAETGIKRTCLLTQASPFMKADCSAPLVLPQSSPAFAIRAIALLAHTGLPVRYP